jgi:formylglycine-generating enzyme required for sulfatase activity
MASAITLEGIDQTISNLKYQNKNTLKYRFVQHIRQYYTGENSVELVNEIAHEELIKVLWDTDHSLEAIKNKRKNLNSVRSSVNADLKKLYEKGGNPEGIKIGSSNIFVMSEDAKDKILKKVGCDLQPDGTLKLDQIMDILKLANETVSASMAVENTEKKGGLKKIDRLKDLIKGLSEQVGLDSPELSNTASEDAAHDISGKGGEEESGSMEMAGVLDEVALEEVDEVEEIADLDDDVEYIEGDEEEVLDDVEDVLYEEDTELDYVEEVEEVEEIADLNDEAEYIESGAEEEILDDFEDVEIDEIADTDTDDLVESVEIDEELADVLDEEDIELDDVESVDDVEEILEDEIPEEQAGEFGSGDEDAREGIGPGQDPGPEKTGIDIGGDEALFKDVGAGLEDGDKKDGESAGHDMPGNAEHRFEEGEEQKGNEQLGLPVGSLGQEYCIEADSKIKKDKLLAEEFDGYLGSMDRHYNHYILIPDGEYIIGSKHPKKDEKPEQVVYLEPFYFGRFPITNGLFEIFVEKTGYKTTAEKIGYGTVYYGRFEKKKDETTGLITSTWNSSLYCKTVEGACWYQPSGPKNTLYNKRNHPVVQISMEDAMAFAAWTGKRLPTENEWEAASRNANGRIFPWGAEWKKDACNVEDSCTADTTSVDKYVEFENDLGIVDTIGNVLEWTNDSFYSTSNNHGAKYRAVRGGSWISGNDIRLFSRFMMEPESHSNILGFRCVAY